ncbi:pyrroline-5-carboxylate reductase [Acuticoccus sp. MNP-M23]|uniref:pyrroline-5-carboxylate reductase n=1 Tax=Acuticoccus sp. MNP-M23 TaxID=3072793 RepID=UPI002814B684|nr:pyrroline-5-carboxylate reductase [Acuticoccus sp. MNP-M23]WMS44862.1 pyrroline-5-carboxylate reductase [Acuticoccus sp. MNP-M23]
MTAKLTAERPLVLVGAGNMGGAMLEGWLASGIEPELIVVVDPAADRTVHPFDTPGLTVMDKAPQTPAGVIFIAVKPYLVADVLPTMKSAHDERTMLVSIAAGVPIVKLQAIGPGPVVRAMPNTPASIGEGATVAVADGTSEGERALADTLLSAIGKTWWLTEEPLLDAVTGVSGSGPAYVFHMVEALTAAGIAEGLPADLAAGIARQTVVGAGALLGRSPLEPGTLRENVTSKGGTTAAALGVLQDSGALTELMTEAVKAAAARSREFGS